MRTVMIAAAAVITFFASPVLSQDDPGWFVLYTNAELTHCFIEPVPGPVTVYVVSHFGSGIGGARFRLVPDLGLNWQYVDETVPGFPIWIYGFTGNANNGIVLEGGWGGFSTVLLAVNYVAATVPEPCARLRIEPYPGSGASSAEVLLIGGWTVPTFVYDLAAQPCSVPWCVLGTPVQNNTWGGIKALYR